MSSHVSPFRGLGAGLVLVGVCLVGSIAVFTNWPFLAGMLSRQVSGSAADHEAAAHDDDALTHHDESLAHDEHDHASEHDHAHDHDSEHDHSHEHDETQAIQLTSRAIKNLGLTERYLQPIELKSYRRHLTVPAIIVPRPGRTQIHVSSPLSGVITHVHAVTGEAVERGDLLFEVRLTYEDLVDSQTQFLKTLAEREVEQREIERLEAVTQSGAVSAKVLLDRRYANDKLTAALQAQREALKLHGLSESQIDSIEQQRQLLRDLQIEAPDIDSHDEHEPLNLAIPPNRPVSFSSHRESQPRTLVVEDLRVHKGQGVAAGEMLCSLSDFSQLFIEGQAFEQDAPAITKAVEEGWTVKAVLQNGEATQEIEGLKLAFINHSIDVSARTLSFYVELPNEVIRDITNEDGQRFVTWKYRVGQRLQLQVPVEQWEQQIVLPIEAVVKDGVDWFVFQQNGDHFERVAVHVKYRDQSHVVIEHDGAIYPGDVVALKAAHQIQMAIKNKSGGAVDPHAGHNH